MAEPLVIPVAHDFNCEWCWVGLHQILRLRREFELEFEWLGYEQYPEEDPWLVSPARPRIPNRPTTPSRLDLQLALHDLTIPDIDRPKKTRTYNAHQAVEFLKESGKKPDDFIESIYRAFWEQGCDINDIHVLTELARGHVEDVSRMTDAIARRRYRDRTVKFDAEAYKNGVFNIPTFWIGGERYAEQPYRILAEVIGTQTPQRLNASTPVSETLNSANTSTIYTHLTYPSPPKDRPYTFINMVATIDGKILTGGRDEPVVDLGSKFDHQMMKRIESSADAVLLGAQTLRAAKKTWNPAAQTRIVISRSGNLPFDSCFFTGNPIIASPEPVEAPDGIEQLHFQSIEELLSTLKARGIDKLLVLGGSTLNAELFQKEQVDEIFLTLAPKIKLGEDVPTIADGEPLPRERIQNYTIVERHQVGDELFLRYRRNR
jgi:riboflavin biosynthesis pyrimidine reductase/predicted DsbA family dithiol-disulfide isomerase